VDTTVGKAGEDRQFVKLLQFLQRSRGVDLSSYKKPTLQRRLLKRMQAKGLESFEEYIDYLEVHQDEFQHLFNTILINVTSFFRDEQVWAFVRSDVIPAILASQTEEPIRVWSAGCSAGHEAYTIAMVLCEAMGERDFRKRVKIYATDADEDALTQARTAAYTEADVQAVPPELRQRYFAQTEGRYVLDREMRRTVIFGRHDLLQDAPISRVDLLLCRNTLMYFNPEAQHRVLSRFFFALNPEGFLVLGNAEALLSHNTLFTPVDIKRRVFTKRTDVQNRDRSSLESFTMAGDLIEAQLSLRDAVLNGGAAAHVVVDTDGRLHFANQAAKVAFGLSSRDVGRLFQDLEISYRPIELRSGVEQAISQKRNVEHKEVAWVNPLGETVHLDVTVAPLYDGADKLLGVNISWEDVTHFKRLQDELLNFNQELETAYEELQSTNEELQTTNEELQSTVEELETTNEELQSSNEELETMNEELHSANEELESVNEELRHQGDQLNEANTFLQAILAGFPHGVFVVDKEMQVAVR
jgi:two-component system CheB/CheR fusion protein